MRKKKLPDHVKGFTLMEVIVVIAILGALTALALPKFTGVLANSQLKTDQANVSIVQSAVELYRAENEDKLPTVATFDALVTALNNAGYLKNETISSASGGTFAYNSTSGIVSFTPKTS
ncbi:MAG: prepilin-type N-terminal cleavage/methylation domain-containing protein [Eubacteriaceae bacterium]|nr:prepilin-type N-terminal cleavage/methylation domain-containing protein [Eubacteriaceae bacterium]